MKNRKKITWTSTRLQFFKSKDCQISSTVYPLTGLPDRKFLRAVFIRTLNLAPTKESNHRYHYYAVVTDMSASEMSDEKVLKFYRRRSQVENNIKDIKKGMDFHHFPCVKLKANNVWELIGVIAYNLMRYASFACKSLEATRWVQDYPAELREPTICEKWIALYTRGDPV